MPGPVSNSNFIAPMPQARAFVAPEPAPAAVAGYGQDVFKPSGNNISYEQALEAISKMSAPDASMAVVKPAEPARPVEPARPTPMERVRLAKQQAAMVRGLPADELLARAGQLGGLEASAQLVAIGRLTGEVATPEAVAAAGQLAGALVKQSPEQAETLTRAVLFTAAPASRFALCAAIWNAAGKDNPDFPDGGLAALRAGMGDRPGWRPWNWHTQDKADYDDLKRQLER